MSFVDNVKERVNALDKRVVAATAAGSGLAVFAVPSFAFADDPTVQSTISGMATTVATDGQSMLISVIPVLAPLVAAIIIASIGFKFVKRFSK